MRILTVIVIVGAALAMTTGATAPQDDIIALERAALDRWGAGDPQGFLDTYAPAITYFDIGTEHRLDGHAAMTDYYRPLLGKINIPRYEMIDPKVQRHGEVAVLTYNLRSERSAAGRQASDRPLELHSCIRAGRRQLADDPQPLVTDRAAVPAGDFLIGSESPAASG